MGPRCHRRSHRSRGRSEGAEVRVGKQVVVAAVATAVVLTLNGCGTEGPGVAAKVGDQTVSVAEVNRLTDGYCKALKPQIVAAGQVVPMHLVRSFVVGSLALRAAAEQFAADNDIDVPDGYTERVKAVEAQADGLGEAHRDDFVE